MSRCRIIGLGSPQGDDTVGWRVVEQLQSTRLPASVECIALDRPGPALIHYLQGAERVILVDAADMGAAPGAIMVTTPEQLTVTTDEGPLSGHSIGVRDTLALAAACGILTPPLHLYLVQWQTLEPMAALSPALEQAVPDLCEAIMQEVHSGFSQQGL